MALLKTATATEKMIKKILSDRATETADLETQIEMDGEKIKQAKEAMEIASDESNVEAYKEAKHKKEEAETELEMHKRRLEKLNDKPLITKENYEKQVADIFSEYEHAREQTRQKLLKLAKDMKKESDELLEAYSHANMILVKLQEEIYRNADRARTSNGVIFDRPKSLGMDYTFSWGNMALENIPNDLEIGE